MFSQLLDSMHEEAIEDYMVKLPLLRSSDPSLASVYGSSAGDVYHFHQFYVLPMLKLSFVPGGSWIHLSLFFVPTWFRPPPYCPSLTMISSSWPGTTPYTRPLPTGDPAKILYPLSLVSLAKHSLGMLCCWASYRGIGSLSLSLLLAAESLKP